MAGAEEEEDRTTVFPAAGVAAVATPATMLPILASNSGAIAWGWRLAYPPS